jgi:type I restriction enzyme S subunit
MKRSKDGKRPSGWKDSRLGELLTVIRGVSYKKEDASSTPAPDLVPILRATNIQNGLVFEDFVHVPRDYVSDDQLLRKGDIVVAASSGSRNIVGKAAQLTTDWFGSFGTFCFGLRSKPGVNPGYLAWFLQTSDYRNRVSELSAGVNINNLRATHIEEIRIPLAPLPDQLRIVAELEKQFTRLEAAVAALRRVQANLKRYRAAVLKAACEARLVAIEAELAKAENRKFETGEELLARILTERRHIHERAQACTSRKRKYKEPKPPNIQAGEQLPDGWTWTTWDQIGFSQNGRPFPSAQYQAAGIRLLRPGNLHVSGKVVWSEENTRCMPQKFAGANPDLLIGGGELVMNLTAQSLKDEFLGRVCVTDHDEKCLLNQRLARLTPIIVPPQFVLYLLKSWRFRRYVDGLNSGSLIQHMFTSQLAEFTFPLPPLAEQRRIVAEVERRLSVVEDLDAVVSANLRRAIRLRQAILQRVFGVGF